jgi:hypothetical protein
LDALAGGDTVKRTAVSTLAAVLLMVCGCGVSREIRNVRPPAGQPSLEELDRHLDYVDPDAGRPSYVIEQR